MSEAPLKVPERTTPTWEMELLISGASVFSLIQFPQWLESRYLHWIAFDTGTPLLDLANPLLIYAKTAAYILAITFTLHLILRAYWVGLVGVCSIFTTPIDASYMEKRNGPHLISMLMPSLSNVPATIESADNRSTLVFAVGIVMAMIMIPATSLIGLSFSAAMLTWQLTGEEAVTTTVFLVILCLLLAIIMLPMLFDRYFGSRFALDSRGGQRLQLFFKFSSLLGFSIGRSALFGHLFNKGPRQRRIMIIAVIALTVAAVISIKATPRVQAIAKRDQLSIALHAAHYGDQRGNDLRFAFRPYIESMKTTTTLVLLTVPLPRYLPESSLPTCKSKPFSAHIGPCLQQQLHISVDGKRLPLKLLATSSQDEQRAALVSMIDISALMPGEHQLQIDYPVDSENPRKTGREIIRFWK